METSTSTQPCAMLTNGDAAPQGFTAYNYYSANLYQQDVRAGMVITSGGFSAATDLTLCALSLQVGNGKSYSSMFFLIPHVTDCQV